MRDGLKGAPPRVESPPDGKAPGSPPPVTGAALRRQGRLAYYLSRQRLPIAGAGTRLVGDEHGLSGQAKPQWRIVGSRFVRQPRAMVCLVFFLVLWIASILLGIFWKYNFTTVLPQFAHIQYAVGANGQLTQSLLGGPSLTHPFGLDLIGHDNLAEVMRGTQTEIQTAFVVAGLAVCIGTTIGSLAGFYGRWVDQLLMRFTDVILAVPLLAVLITLSNAFSRQSGGWLPIALIIGFLAWTYVARLVRADFLSLRERDFIEAARAVGARHRRIIVRHMLPNAIGPIIVNATITVANAIIIELVLSFLGLGIQPPDVSLGRLIADGETYSSTLWWLFAFPAIFIVAMVLSVNFIGDGLREAFDPRKVRVRR